VILNENEAIWNSSPWALIGALKKDYPEIEKGSWYYRTSVNTRYEEKNYYERIALVAPEFFEMFSFPYVKGDPKTALEDLNSIVLSERAAAKYFGKINPMGKVIKLENQVDLTVTGVIKDVPTNSHMQFDLVARPEVFINKERMQTWRMDCPSYVLLSKGTDYKKVVSKISGTINKYEPQSHTKYSVGLTPLKKIHLYALSGTNPIVYVYIFSAIAFLVLLVACINFMNLSTARSALRAKEIGVRKVVGANRRDLIKQFFSESIIFSLMALVVAVALVYSFLPTFNTLAEKQLTLDLTGRLSIGIGLLLIALFTGLVSGIYPSLYLSSFKPASIIKSSIKRGGKSHSLRRALIIFQFATAIILIISTSVILKQMNYIKTKDLGLNRDNIITIGMDDDLLSKYKSVKQELLKRSDIINVTSANSLPLRIRNNNTVYWEGMRPGQAEMINFVCVDYDYFETFNMTMTHGRSFSPEHPTDKDNYIINETALKMTGYKDPIGKMYATGISPNEYKKGVLVGVVKDFHGSSLHNEINPTVFFLWEMLPRWRMFVRLKSSNIPTTIEQVKKITNRFSPGFLFSYRFMDDQFNEMYQRDKNLLNLIEYFTFLAIFISFLGLLGLSSFMAERRTKEIAIRKVLGASNAGIVARLFKEFVFLIAIANVIAWPVAFNFMNEWIKDFAYHTDIGWLIFPLAGVISLSIALGTVSFQTYKAAYANPIDSLKYE
jgi:ABC-type antimicrobial peptide transport system permease subunit